MGKLKKYTFEADITGNCSVSTNANTLDDAINNIEEGNWVLEEGSQEWEANVNGGRNGVSDCLIEVEET